VIDRRPTVVEEVENVAEGVDASRTMHRRGDSQIDDIVPNNRAKARGTVIFGESYDLHCISPDYSNTTSRPVRAEV
jgi:hypothetical protein